MRYTIKAKLTEELDDQTVLMAGIYDEKEDRFVRGLTRVWFLDSEEVETTALAPEQLLRPDTHNQFVNMRRVLNIMDGEISGLKWLLRSLAIRVDELEEKNEIYD